MHSYLTHRAPFGTRGGCAQAGPRGAYTPCCTSYAPSNRHRAIGIRHQRLRAAGAAGAAARRHELEEAMRTALAAEDYATAARLKQEIAALPEEREASLRRRLQEAIAAERYQEAAALRDELQLLELSAQAAEPAPEELRDLQTWSDATTRGIQVHVESFYVAAQSMPSLGQYFFVYKVSITNTGAEIVQLRNRHWLIRDAQGQTEHVRGPGVVGEQPILNPGKTFEYQSACPLRTPYGSMEGEYECVVLNPATAEWGEKIDVRIARFGLNKSTGPQLV